MIFLMPFDLILTAVMSSVDWKKVFKGVATDTVGKAAKSLVGRLKPDERERSAKHVVQLFAKEFLGELEDKLRSRLRWKAIGINCSGSSNMRVQKSQLVCNRTLRRLILGRSNACGVASIRIHFPKISIGNW